MKETIINILKEVCGSDEIVQEMDTDLFEAGFLDSLGVIDLIVQIEQKTGISIDPMEVEREDFNTPNKIITYVSSR